jgi:uncharacterized protein (TIGR03435 family)
METQKYCTGCHRPLSPTAPQGLCPECLIKAGLGTGVDIGPETQAGRPKIPFTPPQPRELAPHFPQLEILEFIGQGGMGAVYKARQKQLDRLVALKILPPQAASGPGFAERFTREARALAKLNHPHIVTLYEFGQTDGLFYLLMELVDGINLQQLLNAGRITPDEALAIVPQICDALQFAHQRGIVHRDIKPGNILLSKAGDVKIADFGVAKIMAEGWDQTAAGQATREAGELTEAGSVLGTPAYMAPEQIAHPLAVDHRADIYSLGVVFYQMLTGELPAGKFEPPSKKVLIDVRLDEVVLRALEKQPELRYQQAGDVKTQVETIAATRGAGGVSDSVSNQSSSAATVVKLDPLRWRTMPWAIALAAGALELGLNVSPVPLGLVIGIVGVSLSVVAATLVLVWGGNLSLLHLARRLVAMDGVFMASVAIWAACSTPVLYTPSRDAIVVACLGGIVYGLRCLAGCETQTPPVQKPRPFRDALQRRFRRLLRVELPVVLIIAVVIRAFFLQAFRTATDAAAPEIPRGSGFLVWKLTHTFLPGDLIAYRLEAWVSLGRVVRNDQDVIWVNRNGKADVAVPRDRILGKVVSVFWRASNRASPIVFLRPSSSEQQNFNSTDSKLEARAMPLGALLSYAYGLPKLYVHWSEHRVIFPPGLARGRFDFLAGVSDQTQEALQAEIKKQLGLIAHREKRETNVLVLIVSNPSLIGRAVATGGNASDGRHGPGRWDFTNMPIDDVSDFLEVALGQPVINETELTQKFSGSLTWKPQPDPAAERTEIQNALLTEFGLELVPRREPVEMLVVEKMN